MIKNPHQEILYYPSGGISKVGGLDGYTKQERITYVVTGRSGIRGEYTRGKRRGHSYW